MLIFGYVICGIAAIIAIPALTASLYMLLVTLASLIPRRIRRRKSCSAKIAILIPVHNGEQQIEKIVTSLIADIDYPSDLYEPIVIAENCTDSTSYLASFSGARVLDHTNEWKTGKHYAIEWAFEKLKKEQFDLFLILNVDSVLKPNTLRDLDAEFTEGHIAMQLTEESTNRNISWFQALNLGLEASSKYMQPRGRDRVGFSSPLTGNGSCLTKHILEQIPFTVTDNEGIQEYHLRLITAGEKVRFVCGKNSGVVTDSDITQSHTTIDEKHLKKQIIKYLKESIKGNCTAFESLINLALPSASAMLVLSIVLIFAGRMLSLGADLPGCEVLVKLGLPIMLIAAINIISLHIYIIMGILELRTSLKIWIATLIWPVVIIAHLLLGESQPKKNI